MCIYFLLSHSLGFLLLVSHLKFESFTHHDNLFVAPRPLNRAFVNVFLAKFLVEVFVGGCVQNLGGCECSMR